MPRRGIRLGVGAAAVCAAAAPVYLPVFAGLVRQWADDPNAAYGSLVAVAAVVATWQRWSRLQSTPTEGSAWGVAALLAASALYVVATLAADVFLLRASAVAFVAAALWFACGTAHMRLLAAPLVLCLAAIPPPQALVVELTMPMQLAASQLSAAALGAIGFEVVRDGNVLTLGHVTLEVAEACSGMRSAVTLLALVAVYWGTGGPPPRRALALAAAVLPIALVGNSLRVVATALLAARMGDEATRGVVHDATGFVAFVVMCAALAAIHVFASRLPAGRAGVRRATA